MKLKKPFSSKQYAEFITYCVKNGLYPVESDDFIEGKIPPKPTDDERSVQARCKRDQFLLKSDWTQIPDCPLNAETKSAWATYRQYLRDVPGQEGFPDIEIKTYEEWKG